MAQDRDPVGNGFRCQPCQPGGNITGLATLTTGFSWQTRLELLKEILPKLSRACRAQRLDRDRVIRKQYYRARSRRTRIWIELQYLEVAGSKDIETAFRAAAKGRAEGVLVLTGPVINSQRKQIAELAARNRLPVYSPFPYMSRPGSYVL